MSYDGETRVDAEGRITRVVTLVWVDGEWRNRVTGIRVPGLNPPNISQVHSSAWDGQALRMWDVESLERLINRVIDDRLVFARHQHYFTAPDKIPTVEIVRGAIDRSLADVRAELPHQLSELIQRMYPHLWAIEASLAHRDERVSKGCDCAYQIGGCDDDE